MPLNHICRDETCSRDLWPPGGCTVTTEHGVLGQREAGAARVLWEPPEPQSLRPRCLLSMGALSRLPPRTRQVPDNGHQLDLQAMYFS